MSPPPRPDSATLILSYGGVHTFPHRHERALVELWISHQSDVEHLKPVDKWCPTWKEIHNPSFQNHFRATESPTNLVEEHGPWCWPPLFPASSLWHHSNWKKSGTCSLTHPTGADRSTGVIINNDGIHCLHDVGWHVKQNNRLEKVAHVRCRCLTAAIISLNKMGWVVDWRPFYPSYPVCTYARSCCHLHCKT